MLLSCFCAVFNKAAVTRVNWQMNLREYLSTCGGHRLQAMRSPIKHSKWPNLPTRERVASQHESENCQKYPPSCCFVFIRNYSTDIPDRKRPDLVRVKHHFLSVTQDRDSECARISRCTQERSKKFRTKARLQVL